MPTKRQQGRRIRALRKERGLSMTKLAARAGLTRQGVSYVEQGAVQPTLPTLQAIAKALGVTLSDLIG